MRDIGAWLQGLGLGQYAEAFAAADVDADVLRDLGEGDLEKLGVSLGHRKKLLKAIAALTSEADERAAGASHPVRPAGHGENATTSKIAPCP